MRRKNNEERIFLVPVDKNTLTQIISQRRDMATRPTQSLAILDKQSRAHTIGLDHRCAVRGGDTRRGGRTGGCGRRWSCGRLGNSAAFGARGPGALRGVRRKKGGGRGHYHHHRRGGGAEVLTGPGKISANISVKKACTTTTMATISNPPLVPPNLPK